jgi:glycosyltransferase involved in cell wall biosynthesis
LKILQIISSIDPVGGGPTEAVKQLGAELECRGHQVEVASLDPPDAPFVEQCSLPVHPLGPAISAYAFSSRFIPWLRANRRRYDAVIVNGIWQYHSLGAWRVLRNSNTPYFVYTHGMLDPWFKNRYPLKHLKKCLYWPWAERCVLRDAQAVLFTCEEERLLARNSFWLYRCNEAVVSLGTSQPTGDAEVEAKEFNERYPELRDKKLALFMGRIHPKKGCDLLIDAFAKVLLKDPQWHLVMAGPDQSGWQAELMRRAIEFGISTRITWTGMITGGLKWGALRAAKFFVLPSHQENFGISVVEALSVGLPTLISDKVNIWREIVADGGGLVASDTLQGTCRVLQSFLDMGEDKEVAMCRDALACFRKRFEISKAGANLEAVLLQASRTTTGAVAANSTNPPEPQSTFRTT